MRIGLHTTGLLALLAAGFAAAEVAAQNGGGANYQSLPFAEQGGTSPRPVQAMFTQPNGHGSGNPYVDAYNNSGVVPAAYCADGCGADYCEGYGDGCYDGGYACNCGNCGYSPAWGNHGAGGLPMGCGCCGGGAYGGYGYGGTWEDPRSGTCPPFPEDVETYSLLPPGRTEQCGPHYFDVRMEAVTMTRDDAFNQRVIFTSLDVVDPMMPNPDQFVLRSDQLNFDYETGFRILGRYDCGPLSVIEFGYWGLENLDSSASFTDPDPVDADTGNLYSLFTEFVANPADLPPMVTTPGGPLPWTERSITHSISLESELHNAEFNYRRYWVGFNPTVSGTLLAGFRFTRLREDFRFEALGEARGRYDEGIKNDMAGFQTGGDIWFHIRQGIRIGAEGKVGLMNNHYTLVNTFSTSPVAGTPPDFSEKFEKDQPALTVDASADVVWDICPSWSIRAGYEILFLNSVLLAGENFNTGTVYNGIPGVTLPQREPFVNDQGDALYHGGHLGAEFTW